MSVGISHYAVSQCVGPLTGEIEASLQTLCASGMGPSQIAIIAEAIAEERERSLDPASVLDLVISGPDIPGVPTGDTAAAMRTLIAEAEAEVLLVGYAVHNARRLFEPLAAKMRANKSLRVMLCLDISRKLNDTSLESEIVQRFGCEFREKHWPWPDLPQLFYDPRSLSENLEHRSSLHAKCVVTDRRAALITSANFTDAAQHRNIEVGVLVHHPPLIERLARYFDGLIDAGQLVTCPLE